MQGPAFVLDCDAGIFSNEQRLQTVQYSFARRLGIEAQSAIQQMTDDDQSKILAQLPGDAGEFMRAQAQAGQFGLNAAKRPGKGTDGTTCLHPRREKNLQELNGRSISV